jgi:hypothetical protein
MDITRKIATAAVVVLAVGGAGIGTAVASSHSPARAHAASVEPTGPDTDNLQVGDQTSPDSSAAKAGASHAKGEAGNSENGEHGSDGPGGHADPPGNVDHQFNGVE